MLDFFRKYGFSCLMVIFIFYMSVRSTVPDVLHLQRDAKLIFASDNVFISTVSFRDIIGHALFYFSLSVIVSYELLLQKVNFGTKKMWLFAFIVPIIYGGVMELVQEFFFSPRAAEWTDWFSDIVGIIIAYQLSKRIMPKIVLKIEKYI